MFESMENLNILSASRGITKDSGGTKNRKRSAFIFRLSGTIEYNFGDKTVIASPGNVVLFPRGCSYTYKRLFNAPSESIRIHFNVDCEDLKPTVFNISDFWEKDFIYNDFVRLYNSGTTADKYRCMAAFYNLLSYLSGIESQSYAEKKHLLVIEPAIEYLQKHLFSPTLSAGELHRQCGVSDAYFRRLFISRFGLPPSKYIITKRLSQAKAIIESGDFDTISDVAAEVGFTDPLYFSRSFRKKYGRSPTEMNKEV